MTRRLNQEFASASRAPESRYVASSLNLMAADTRDGLSAEAVRDMEVVRDYAGRHPERTDITDYMARVTGSAGAPAAPSGSRPDAPKA